jgi:redox-sensitive bicupin YhaK (pirin superfamily)
VFLYVARGGATVDDAAIERWHLVTLNDDGDTAAVAAGEQGAVLLFGHAEPIGEPVVAHGPVVMNSGAEIRQAIVDYPAGKFQGDGKLVEVGQ